MRYKDFEINVAEDAPGHFRASIIRPDGALLRAAVPEDSPPGAAVVTGSYPTPESAIADAKRSIDAGGIVLVRR